ncbi:MAG: hypothetical protein AB7O48_14170 [Cyclobacteriaceae bacterium]
MDEPDDIYVFLLKKAKERLLKGESISYSEFKTEIRDIKGIEHPESLYRSIYSNHTIGEHGMSLEAYFKLLEFEDLKLARADSRQARKEARIAIWVAVILGVLQLVLGYLQISKPCS